jgi:hypothetical protein
VIWISRPASGGLTSHRCLAGGCLLVSRAGAVGGYGTGLRCAPGRRSARELASLGKYVLSPLAPFIRYWSIPARAAKVITNVLLNEPGVTGVYYDDRGQPMLGSTLARDPEFQDRVVAETRALLSTILA